MTRRDHHTLSPYQNMSPRKRRAFKREDQKALAEITKRMRRFGFFNYSNRDGYRSSNTQSGFEPFAIFVKSKKIVDSQKYKDYPNATIQHVVYLDRNLKERRTHQFFDDQIKFKKPFFPYKEIVATGGMLIDYNYNIITPDHNFIKGHATIYLDSMIKVELSDFMPNITGAVRKGRPINNIIPQPRYYCDCIISATQLRVFLKAPIRPNELEHIPTRAPRNMEPKLY